MKIEINLPKIGNLPGTTGWLAESLKNGLAQFVITNSSNEHSLSLHYQIHTDQVKDCTPKLFKLTNQDDQKKYDVVQFIHIYKKEYDFFTVACQQSLHNFARKWCNEQNKIRDEDQEIDIAVADPNF